MRILKKLIYLLTSSERKTALLVFGMILIMGFLDLLGVASIMPFMAVLTDPNIIESNRILNTAFKTSINFGVENKQQFIFLLGILVFFILIFSLSFKALTAYAQVRFSKMREYSICKRLLEGYLHQPYSWFLKRNSSNLTKTILSEVDTVVNVGLYPFLILISQLIVVVFLLIFLIFVDPILTLCVGISLIGIYFIIYRFSKNFIKKIGEERLKANEKRFKSLNEAFGAVKQLKVSGLEEIYFKKFNTPAIDFALRNAWLTIVSQLPRYVLEAISFGGMILVILYLMADKGTFITAVPIIALYAFAGYRLIPALQRIYQSYSEVQFSEPAIDILYEDLKSLQPKNNTTNKEIIKLNKSIFLHNIHYNYPDSSKKILKDISLEIPAYSFVGIVGSTGSGKTTTVDIILGLLESQKGTLKVDDKVIDSSNVRAWQSKIGYVPQDIYLTDDTIEANIAFGVEEKKINFKAVEYASKIANLHDFVIDELPHKYQTIVGERGVRLSGGQRQRIGIARAIYHKPDVIILDEATSALDNQTEHAVLDAIKNLNNKITIIMIAHRLSTIKKCDKIFLFNNGEIKGKGSFEELKELNIEFRAMSNIN